MISGELWNITKLLNWPQTYIQSHDTTAYSNTGYIFTAITYKCTSIIICIQQNNEHSYHQKFELPPKQYTGYWIYKSCIVHQGLAQMIAHNIYWKFSMFTRDDMNDFYTIRSITKYGSGLSVCCGGVPSFMLWYMTMNISILLSFVLKVYSYSSKWPKQS